jgi:hypothetical protein
MLNILMIDERATIVKDLLELKTKSFKTLEKRLN